MRIGSTNIGPGHPCYLIAEVGINHNGNLETAKRLIELASQAGFNAVKFQKRTPKLCVPQDQWDTMRDTPWGPLRYIEYKVKLELWQEEYAEIFALSKELGIHCFASAWDLEALKFIESFDPPAQKVASACLTDLELLRAIRATGKPVILSTGMSTLSQVTTAVEALTGYISRESELPGLALLHTCSTYPTPHHEINLRCMDTLRTYGFPVGYSGHELGTQVSLAAVAMGATILERHITLDRSMWGTDQSASLEPAQFQRLVRDIRIIEASMGDRTKRIQPGEVGPMERLRRV